MPRLPQPGAEDVTRAARGDVEGAAVHGPGAQAARAPLRQQLRGQGAAQGLGAEEIPRAQGAWSFRACFTQAA